MLSDNPSDPIAKDPYFRSLVTVNLTPDQLRALVPVYLETDFPGRRPSTIHWAGHWVEKYLTWMKACHYTSITHENLQRYVGYLYDRCKPSSANNILTIVRRFLKWLERAGHCQYTPRNTIRTPRVKKEPTSLPITRDEYMKLREVAAGHWMDWVIMLGWYTGMSMSDCMGLRWANVDFEHCVISIRRIKTGTPSMIPFGPNDELGRALIARHESNPKHTAEDFVSPEAGMRLRPNAPNIGTAGKMAFFHIRKAAGLPKGKSFHGLRHSFVSMLANSGMSTVLASKVSGHLDPRVFSQYVHPDPEVLHREVAEARSKSGNLREIAPPPVDRRYQSCKSYVFRPDTTYVAKRGRIKLPDGSDILYVRTSANADGKQAVVFPCDESGEPTSNMQLVVDIRDVSRFS